MGKPLLLNFSDTSSRTSASRDSLKAIAEALGVTETKAAHIAINRLYADLFRRVEDEEVTPEDFQAASIPNDGDVIVARKSLLDAMTGPGNR